MDDSGEIEHLTQDSSGLEDYRLEPAGQCVEGAGGSHMPIAGRSGKRSGTSA